MALIVCAGRESTLKPRGPREKTLSACGLVIRRGAVTPASLDTFTRNVRQPCSTSSGRARPLRDAYAALGIDVDVEKAVAIESLLNSRRRGPLVRACDRGFEGSPVALRQGRSEILQRLEQARHLRRQRLQFDGDDGRASSRLKGREHCREAGDQNGGQSMHGLDSTAGPRQCPPESRT